MLPLVASPDLTYLCKAEIRWVGEHNSFHWDLIGQDYHEKCNFARVGVALGPLWKGFLAQHWPLCLVNIGPFQICLLGLQTSYFFSHACQCWVSSGYHKAGCSDDVSHSSVVASILTQDCVGRIIRKSAAFLKLNQYWVKFCNTVPAVLLDQ